jgi:hypothetical protein
MKVLNLFAGIGGNRLLWNDVLPDIDVTSVEFDPAVAEVYKFRFPTDNVIVCDAFDYVANNCDKFDFIWASPPCQSHSRINFSNRGRVKARFLPDFRLYSLISFLSSFYKGKFVVENVIPYYAPLINPSVKISRHLFWSNYSIPYKFFPCDKPIQSITISDFKDFDLRLFDGLSNKRQLIRNQVNSALGKYVFNCAFSFSMVGSY